MGKQLSKLLTQYNCLGVDFSHFKIPDNVKCHKPINDKLMKEVIVKLKKGQYIYQL